MNYIHIKGSTNLFGFNVSLPKDNIGSESGNFEIWDLESNGYDYYEEGSLLFEDDELIDYDGIHELPDFIINVIAKSYKISI